MAPNVDILQQQLRELQEQVSEKPVYLVSLLFLGLLCIAGDVYRVPGSENDNCLQLWPSSVSAVCGQAN